MRRWLVDAIVVRHPLQAFSREYFRTDDGDDRDRRLFSYAEAGRVAAEKAVEAAQRAVEEGQKKALAAREKRSGDEEVADDVTPAEDAERREAPLFLRKPLQVRRDEVVSLADLERFLEHPARYLVRDRLGVVLGREAIVLDDREPLELDALGRWGIGDAMLRRILADRCEPEEAFRALRAAGMLPPGELGERLFGEVRPMVIAIAAEARPHLEAKDRQPLEVDVSVPGARIVGTLRQLRDNGLVDCRYSRLGKGHEVRFWLRHLVLGLAEPSFVEQPTVLFGRPVNDGEGYTATFAAPDREAREEILGALVRLFRKGSEAPLRLFPATSRAYVQELLQGTDPGDALRTVGRAFHGKKEWAEGNDDYVRKLWGDRDPVGDAAPLPGFDRAELPGFDDASRTVYEPLFRHRTPKP